MSDWWAFGEHRYGDRAKAAAEGIFGRAFQSLMNAASVARKFETSRRREVLSWSHHAEVASLPAPQADALLDEAEAEGWSQRELRQRVSQVKVASRVLDGGPPQTGGAVSMARRFAILGRCRFSIRSDPAQSCFATTRSAAFANPKW